MKSSTYNKLQHYLIGHACMNISYINWTRTENEERSDDEGGFGGGSVRGCSLGEPLKRQETVQTSLYIQIRA